ncbi:hypothetical protein GDO81_018009 [Engystomops pustulosus]|uniref:Uncharacterized protein n=1 Tax=Engystomops pustulosus TaxID=76066 RepID=A0AAV7ADY9_ENGPU|nr:hypothetical protein GDO81_018009 [Engystomops pustulosus]
MQRSRNLGTNMDKQWEAERRGAKRAEARLNNGIQEIEEAQHYHMSTMTKEQKRLQKDLIRIKQATVRKTSNMKNSHQMEILQTPGAGKSQLVSSAKGPVMASGSSITLQMRINDFMDGVKKVENPQQNGAEILHSGTSVTDAKSSSRRTSISSVTEDTKNDQSGKSSGLPASKNDKGSGSVNPQFLKQRRGSLFKDKIAFDEEIYAPDGGLRTLHTMPDFMDSLEKAQKARYIRHRVKPESEKELSVGEIFQKEDDNGFP